MPLNGTSAQWRLRRFSRTSESASVTEQCLLATLEVSVGRPIAAPITMVTPLITHYTLKRYHYSTRPTETEATPQRIASAYIRTVNIMQGWTFVYIYIYIYSFIVRYMRFLRNCITSCYCDIALSAGYKASLSYILCAFKWDNPHVLDARVITRNHT